MKLKGLLLVLFVILSSGVWAQVMPQTTVGNGGQTLFRVANNTNLYLSCFYRDQYNYVTFSVPPYCGIRFTVCTNGDVDDK